MYTTEIAVGNPPIHFKAIIETGFSDILVPFSNCSEPEYCDKHPLYNSSQSLTYVSNGRPVRVINGIYYSWGNASIDSFHVGDIEVKQQTFEEATILRPGYFFPESWHDSALTMSREIVYNDAGTTLNVPSPFQNMVLQDLLAQNVFSMKLPRKVHERGLLIMGDRPDDFDAQSPIELPLFNNSASVKHGDDNLITSGGWEVEPVYLHFGSGEHEIYTTIFTAFPPLSQLIYPS